MLVSEFKLGNAHSDRWTDDTLSQAFERGVDDFILGKDHNPYDYFTEPAQWKAWAKGHTLLNL